MDGNKTINTSGLVDFTKFRMLVQSIYNVLNHTIELEYFPFFPEQIMVQRFRHGSIDDPCDL